MPRKLRKAVFLLFAAGAAVGAEPSPGPAAGPAPAPAVTPSPAPAAEPDVAALVKNLGAEEWEAREEASAALAKVGEKAEPLLREALRSPDPEVVSRATELLRPLVLRRLARRGYMGIQYSPFANGVGISVDQVLPDTPADRAGLRAGDVILSFGGEDCAKFAADPTSREWARMVRGHAPGEKIPAEVLRREIEETENGTKVLRNERVALEIVLGSFPENMLTDEEREEDLSKWESWLAEEKKPREANGAGERRPADGPPSSDRPPPPSPSPKRGPPGEDAG